MDKPFTGTADRVRADLALLREAAPDAAKAFGALAMAATATKALDTKTKELMAVAIGIAMRCHGCIAIHMRSAVKAGATRQEVAETIALAIYMGGGPAVVYGGEALRAFDEFAPAAPA
ncbi:MAG TPA: carboxymuconolactone decarboxylase family protein [Burkholderiales bacterium]|nr:carboxymuconolactone decarboxylase family protein [Burkholderiales bacterium]